MAERPEYTEYDTATAPMLPSGTSGMRLTKEQLEAAERTRAYHLRRLQHSLAHGEGDEETSAGRSEH